jgi:thiol-disulfide isomerase/thioredoxin
MRPAPPRRQALARLLGLGALAAPWAAQAAPPARGERITWPALTLLDGTPLPATHWADRAAVVVFWSTTCPFCRRHNQHVEKLQQAARREGAALTVLGVARDRDATTVQRYAQAQGYSFPITMEVAPLAAALSPRNMIPLTVAVSRQGLLHQVLPGEMFEEDVLELLLLARRA